MDKSRTSYPETEPLDDRLSRLAAAILRINDNLDYESVLQQVIDSATELTGAQYGTITTFYESGQPDAFLTSGITPGERRRMVDATDIDQYYGYLGTLTEPLRTPDYYDYSESLGMPGPHPLPVGAFLAAPIRHQRVSVGHILLGKEKSRGEFSRDDEDTLVMFAAQAALVIANARRYRDERRARAELETLINTSPVGVAVFDGRTGAPVSFNREARRMVDGLTDPDQPPEQLLETLTVRRDDGREVSLAELPMAQLLSAGETLRAEELTLSVPDGRSIAVLVNVTPMLTEEGKVESAVVTLQDMTPLKEMERLRAEFLGMVSHELRTPLTSIKGSADTLLESFNSLDSAEMVQFIRIIKTQTERMRDLISDLLDVARIETGTLPVTPGPVEVGTLVDEARNTFLTGAGRRNITIDMELSLPWVMADRRRIVQVLCNLLTNAARYSSDSSTIRVNASLRDDSVAMSVTDEGRGVSPEEMPLLFRKFSRPEGKGREGEAADTGLGLAICKGIVEAHGGRIWAESDGVGLGATFTFTVPVAGDAGVAVESPEASGVVRNVAGNQDRILVVDDDPATLQYVRDALARAGYAPVVTTDPDDALRMVESEHPRLVLLDLMLPGSDGIELMRSITEIVEVPVVFISAYGRDETIAKAIDAGAADYMVKPFSPTELLARVRGALRRRLAPAMDEPPEPFVLGDLVINYAERQVSVTGRVVHMTPTEYELLFELSSNAGRVLTYETLLQRVWRQDHSGGRGSVRTYVKRLRAKLGDKADNPEYIFAQPRVGYRMPRAKPRC